MSFRSWVLEEAYWNEIFTAAADARKYPNKWIHFSQIPKLGINPKKGHRDPPGMYFYNTSWLSDEDNNIHGYQFAISYPYYFIVDIQPDTRGIVLAKLDFYQAKAVALVNGWLQEFMAVYNDPSQYLQESPAPKNLWRRKHIGTIFYATGDLLANGDREGKFPLGKKPWLQTLRGVPYIIDKQGIVASGEPVQAIVMDIRKLKILSSGENKQKNYEIDIARETMNRLGGTIRFKHGKVYGDFQYKGKPVEILFNIYKYSVSLTYNTQGIRVTRPIKVTRGTFIDLAIKHDVDSIIYNINSHLEEAKPEKKGKDLYWNYEKLVDVFHRFVPGGNINTFIKDGQYTVQGDGYRIMGRVTTDASDSLKIYIGRYEDDKQYFNMTRKISKPKNEQDEERKLDKIENDYNAKVRQWYAKIAKGRTGDES